MSLVAARGMSTTVAKKTAQLNTVTLRKLLVVGIIGDGREYLSLSCGIIMVVEHEAFK